MALQLRQNDASTSQRPVVVVKGTALLEKVLVVAISNVSGRGVRKGRDIVDMVCGVAGSCAQHKTTTTQFH